MPVSLWYDLKQAGSQVVHVLASPRQKIEDSSEDLLYWNVAVLYWHLDTCMKDKGHSNCWKGFEQILLDNSCTKLLFYSM